MKANETIPAKDASISEISSLVLLNCKKYSDFVLFYSYVTITIITGYNA